LPLYSEPTNTPLIDTQHPQATHARTCKYCYGAVPDGQQTHDYCASNFGWEQKMRRLNPHWRPANTAFTEDDQQDL
jgi:hypothetical protein